MCKALEVVKREGDIVQSYLIETGQVRSGISSGKVNTNADCPGVSFDVWVRYQGRNLVQGSLATIGVQRFQVHINLKIVNTVDVSSEVFGDLLVDHEQVTRSRRHAWGSAGTVGIFAKDQPLWYIAIDASLRDDEVKFVVITADAGPGIRVNLVPNVLQRVAWSRAVNTKQLPQQERGIGSHLSSRLSILCSPHCQSTISLQSS